MYFAYYNYAHKYYYVWGFFFSAHFLLSLFTVYFTHKSSWVLDCFPSSSAEREGTRSRTLQLPTSQ